MIYDGMKAEIKQVRQELIDWAQDKSGAIRATCNVIVANLTRLVARPDDSALRTQTMKNIQTLAGML